MWPEGDLYPKASAPTRKAEKLRVLQLTIRKMRPTVSSHKEKKRGGWVQVTWGRTSNKKNKLSARIARISFRKNKIEAVEMSEGLKREFYKERRAKRGKDGSCKKL